VTEHLITVVGEDDLEALLPLMRDYCDFYAVAPPDDELLALSRTLIADREHEGLQLIGREPNGRAVGFATLFWLWSTLSASRIGLMNDLFVSGDARGGGLAERLIAACRERCADRGATALVWQTAKDNHRAQAVYDRVGGHRAEWLDYTLAVP
jgi:GNAT superfamily N-acetyltransferase